MKFNYKSRKGFTLIELLVVIGILAVLAAIAIPSVAGLIDKANMSADNTNANEMTNAMERFVSEYELYKQDIASGAIKDGNGDGVPDNMDAAQGRVYNVTKAVTRADIEAIESEVGLNGIRIDIDNKYAQNHKTAKAVVQNYMKTSSSTFEPKQSDMTYWYNTVTGYTVVAEKDVNTAELYKLLPQEIQYGNTQNSSLIEWIDLTNDISIPDFRSVNILRRTTKNGYKKIHFWFEMPNPKFFDTYELSNIYLMYGFMGNETLDIVNNDFVQNLDDMFSEVNHQRVEESMDNFVDWCFPVKIDPTDADKPISFRLAYKYIEDGHEKIVYSSTFVGCFNELPPDTRTTLPNFDEQYS